MLPIPICRSRLKRHCRSYSIWRIGFVAYIHWNTPNEKRRIEINCIFLYFAGIRRKGSYILFFFSEREYDDTLFPDNG